MANACGNRVAYYNFWSPMRLFWSLCTALLCIFFIYNIRRIARLFPTVHYTLNLRDTARNEFERNMERRYDFRCRRKPKCSEKTCAGKYGSRTKFTYDSRPTGNRTRVALVKGTGTTAAPTYPPSSCSKENFKINSYQNFQLIWPMSFHFI